MIWRKLDWFEALKQLLVLGLNYTVMCIGVISFSYYITRKDILLLSFFEIGFYIILGRVFEPAYFRIRDKGLKRLFFVCSVFLLTGFACIDVNLILTKGFRNIDFNFARLVMVYAVFIIGVASNAANINYYEMFRKIRLYTIILMVILFIVKDAFALKRVIPWTLAYIGLSLVTLGVFNIDTFTAVISKKYTRSIQKRWLLILVVLSLCVIFISLFLYGLYSPAYLKSFWMVIKKVYFVFADLVVVLLIPISYIVGFLTFLLKKIINPRDAAMEAEEIDGELFNLKYYTHTILPSEIKVFFKGAFLIIILLIFTVLLMLALKRFKAVEPTEFEEERESVFKWNEMKQEMFGFLKQINRRFVSSKRIKPENTPAYKIRKMYVNLMKKAHEAGYRRKSDQTPLEYTPFIVRAYGQEYAKLIHEITGLYLTARYNPPAVSPEDEAEAETIFKSINKREA